MQFTKKTGFNFTPVPTSVDSILAAFDKTVQDLLTLAKNKNAEAERKQQQIEVATVAKNAALEEATRAASVAAKITNIIA